MNINELLEKKMPIALEYASHLIFETDNFLEFSIALTDYMGDDFIPYCKSVYVMLRGLPHSENIVFLNDEDLQIYRLEYIKEEYNNFRKKEDERKREQEFKDNIDELQFLIKSYRNSSDFKKLLDFVGRFNYLAPYNAMLVQMQKPGATFVFNGKKWGNYGRQPKINGQKLIILKPFGPIQCVFDYSDTEKIPGIETCFSESDLMEEWDKSLMKVQGEISHDVMETLYKNLISYGIFLDDEFRAANTYGGYIMPYTDKELMLKVSKEDYLKVPSRFIISINKNQRNADKFHTICHELGHLFCYHQSYDPDKRRQLSIKEREFEAETVAWLVCKRYGVSNPSEEYLASYAPKGEIPICSLDMIMKSVTEIEKMIKGNVPIKESLWYKEDKNLKKEITDFLKKKRLKKDLFGNPIK